MRGRQNLNHPPEPRKSGITNTPSISTAPRPKIPDLGDFADQERQWRNGLYARRSHVHNAMPYRPMSSTLTAIARAASVFKTANLDARHCERYKRMLNVISLPCRMHLGEANCRQSVFVRASIQGVIREGVIAAALTS